MPNLYTPNLSGMDPQSARIIRDLADRVNYLTTEVDRMKREAPDPGARKENPIPGILTIPYRSHGGQDGFIRVNQDGVISSYSNPVESIFPYVDLSTAGNVGTGTDPLHSYSLGAGILAIDGDYLDITYGGNVADNDNDKQFSVTFDGQSIMDTGLADLDINVGWIAVVRIVRVSSTSIRVSSIIGMNLLQVSSAGAVNTFSAGAEVVARTVTPTGIANLNTNTVVIQCSGVGTADNDITQNLSIIEFRRPRTVKLV